MSNADVLGPLLQIYSYAESSIDNGGSLKGVSFWRWNAISGVANLDAQDAALTLSEPCCHALHMHLRWPSCAAQAHGQAQLTSVCCCLWSCELSWQLVQADGNSTVCLPGCD